LLKVYKLFKTQSITKNIVCKNSLVGHKAMYIIALTISRLGLK